MRVLISQLQQGLMTNLVVMHHAGAISGGRWLGHCPELLVRATADAAGCGHANHALPTCGHQEEVQQKCLRMPVVHVPCTCRRA